MFTHTENLENSQNPPTRVNKIIIEDFDKFKHEIIHEKEGFVKNYKPFI